MSGKAETSRTRAPNFSREDQFLLTRAFERYSHIIESKKTDNIKQAQKQEAWVKVTQIYNANTKNVPRTTENLISCYRNMKSKIKKQHSEAKMILKDSSQKEALINAIEENGKDWEVVSNVINQPIQVCISSFENLQKDFKKNEQEHKKVILGTGGGPPPLNDDPLIRMKKLIEPQIDGLYTMYDGDAELMKEYQLSVPEKDRIVPIEYVYDDVANLPCEDVADDIIENKANYVANTLCEDVVEVLIENKDNYGADLPCEDIVVNKEKKRTFSEYSINMDHEPTQKRMPCGIRPIIIKRTEILKKQKASALMSNDGANMPCEDVAEVFIENKENFSEDSINMEHEPTPKRKQCGIRPIINRTEILKKKKASALISNGEPSSKRQRNVSDSLMNLTEEKLELVRLQKRSEEMKMKMQQLEMDDLIKQNQHKEEMRKRELILMNLQIKKNQ